MPESDQKQTIGDVILSPEIQEMMDAGLFYGCKKTKTHPKMKRFVATVRNNIDIINLENTLIMMEKAGEFLKENVSKGTPLLIVGTQPAAQDSVVTFAEKYDIPSVTTRWLGGTLTNFSVISKLVEYFKKRRDDFNQGVFEKYTKKEQLDIEREIAKLEHKLGGIQNLSTRPAIIIIIDPVVHETATREAGRLGIPIVALVNTNADPEKIDFSVLGNTKSRASIKWFLESISKSIVEGREKPEKEALKDSKEEKTGEEKEAT